MRFKRKYLLLLGLGLFVLVQTGEICWAQSTERVSVDTTGSDANNASNNPSTSANGNHVAFQSSATDLVPGGSSNLVHIFVRDRQANTTTQVSIDSDGNEGDRPSSNPSISGDGRFVAFQSDARNLAGMDMFVFPDIFVHDRDANENGIYDDEGDGYDAGDVITVRVSVRWDGAEGDAVSSAPAISADGRYVAFESSATNLVPPAVSNGLIHIFVHDRDADGDGNYDDEGDGYDAGEVTNVQVSVSSGGTEGNLASNVPSISASGRYVAFGSDATNLVGGDTNLKSDIFVHDRQTGITSRLSVDSAGVQGNGHSYAPSISADGRYVAFYSEATNLVAGDTNNRSDIFVHDLQLGTTRRVGVGSTGGEGNGHSSAPSYSADGEYVAFESSATNLVAGDTNGVSDIFIRESMPPKVTSTGPTDNTTDVAVDASISATFSEEMDASTINGTAFTLDNGVTGTVSYDAISTTATFTPSSDLDHDTTYTATVTTDAEDLAGNDLQANHAWVFTTITQPEEDSDSNSRCFIGTAAD